MNINDVVKDIRKNFEKAISEKTSWGKNEIIKQFDLAIAKTALEKLAEHIST